MGTQTILSAIIAQGYLYPMEELVLKLSAFQTGQEALGSRQWVFGFLSTKMAQGYTIYIIYPMPKWVPKLFWVP